MMVKRLLIGILWFAAFFFAAGFLVWPIAQGLGGRHVVFAGPIRHYAFAGCVLVGIAGAWAGMLQGTCSKRAICGVFWFDVISFAAIALISLVVGSMIRSSHPEDPIILGTAATRPIRGYIVLGCVLVTVAAYWAGVLPGTRHKYQTDDKPQQIQEPNTGTPPLPFS